MQHRQITRAGSCELHLSAVRVNNMPGGLIWKLCLNGEKGNTQFIWNQAPFFFFFFFCIRRENLGVKEKCYPWCPLLSSAASLSITHGKALVRALLKWKITTAANAGILPGSAARQCLHTYQIICGFQVKRWEGTCKKREMVRNSEEIMWPWPRMCHLSGIWGTVSCFKMQRLAACCLFNPSIYFFSCWLSCWNICRYKGDGAVPQVCSQQS